MHVLKQAYFVILGKCIFLNFWPPTVGLEKRYVRKYGFCTTSCTLLYVLWFRKFAFSHVNTDPHFSHVEADIPIVHEDSDPTYSNSMRTTIPHFHTWTPCFHFFLWKHCLPIFYMETAISYFLHENTNFTLSQDNTDVSGQPSKWRTRFLTHQIVEVWILSTSRCLPVKVWASETLSRICKLIRISPFVSETIAQFVTIAEIFALSSIWISEDSLGPCVIVWLFFWLRHKGQELCLWFHLPCSLWRMWLSGWL